MSLKSKQIYLVARYHLNEGYWLGDDGEVAFEDKSKAEECLRERNKPLLEREKKGFNVSESWQLEEITLFLKGQNEKEKN